MSQIKVELQESMGTDRSIAEAAWTSSLTYQGKEKRTEEDVKRVVTMLANDKHSTPFESVIMRFWIKMPIAIDRQHMTHRIGSHNGMSGRYRTMPSEYLEVPDELIALEERLNSNNAYGRHLEMYTEVCEKANNYYNGIIKRLKELEKENKLTNVEFKRAREFYRGMLPQHNMTERITIFNLRSFANYQKLRQSSNAQFEIQEVARLMLIEVKNKNIAPIAIEWLEKNGWNI
jgi:thymidylate synthase (FAD)